MDAETTVAEMDDTIYDVQQRMIATGRWAIPIVENGQYRGIFTGERFWYVYRHVTRRPWLDWRARLLRLADLIGFRRARFGSR